MKATQESATIHQPNSARGYVSLRLVGTAKVDNLDGGRKKIGLKSNFRFEFNMKLESYKNRRGQYF
jgi:hypothetical protein